MYCIDYLSSLGSTACAGRPGRQLKSRSKSATPRLSLLPVELVSPFSGCGFVTRRLCVAHHRATRSGHACVPSCNWGMLEDEVGREGIPQMRLYIAGCG